MPPKDTAPREGQVFGLFTAFRHIYPRPLHSYSSLHFSLRCFCFYSESLQLSQLAYINDYSYDGRQSTVTCQNHENDIV